MRHLALAVIFCLATLLAVSVSGYVHSAHAIQANGDVVVTRHVPEDIAPGQPFEVVLTIEAATPTAVAVLEVLPQGLALDKAGVKGPGHAAASEDGMRLALVAFEPGKITYQVVPVSAQAGAMEPISGAWTDMLVLGPEKDTVARCFRTVEQDGAALSRSNRAITLLEQAEAGREGIVATTLPGAGKDGMLAESEVADLALAYLLGAAGDANLDDVCDAAYVYTVWGGKPKVLVDMIERTVTMVRPAERIVSTNPDNSRTIIALGRSDALVGSDECTIGSCICVRHGNRKGDPKAAPKCWSQVLDGKLDELPQTNTRKSVNHEVVASLLPDVVFESTSWATRAEDISLKTGVPVVVAGSDFTMKQFNQQIVLVGEVLDRRQAAAELAAFNDRVVERVASVVRGIPQDERPTVYFAPRGARKGFYDPTEGRDFTRTYSVYDPLDLAGGANVAQGIIGTDVNVSVEQIIAWNPDFIFVACSSPEDQGVEFILNSPELASIEAVKAGRVYNVFYPHCRGRPAPRNLFNILLFAKLLYPERFADLDLAAEGDAVYKAYLGADGLFTEYAQYLEFPLAYMKDAEVQ